MHGLIESTCWPYFIRMPYSANAMIKKMNSLPDPTIAIVIPVYNEEIDIRNCLESIAKQTVMPHEVIVVDNNSTDWSALVAKQFPFARVLKESRQGIAFARNKGFDAVTSDIIARIDADTRLEPHWVQRLQKYYRSPRHAEHAVSGSGYFYNIFLPDSFNKFQHMIAFEYNRFILGSYILWGSNMALPTKIWKKVKATTSTRTDIHEDIDLAIQLKRHGYTVDYRKSLVVSVRMRRVHSDRASLWSNLMMWPRTFRVHRVRRWPLALIGAVTLFVSSLPLRMIEHVLVQFRGTHPRKMD